MVPVRAAPLPELPHAWRLVALDAATLLAEHTFRQGEPHGREGIAELRPEVRRRAGPAPPL
jgi:hypothetical protein